MPEQKVYFNITSKYGGVTCTVFTAADTDGNLRELAELEVDLKFHYSSRTPEREAFRRGQAPPFLAECAGRLASAITARPDLVPTEWVREPREPADEPTEADFPF